MLCLLSRRLSIAAVRKGVALSQLTTDRTTLSARSRRRRETSHARATVRAAPILSAPPTAIAPPRFKRTLREWRRSGGHPTARMTAARPTPTVRVRKPVLATDPPTPTVQAILAFLATAASTPTAGWGVIARRRQRPPVGALPVSALVTTVTPRRTCALTTATVRVNPYRPASTRPLQATGHVRVTGRRFETRSDCATPAGHKLSFSAGCPLTGVLPNRALQRPALARRR